MAFIPTDLDACVAWYKADQITASDTDPLSTWQDQSGNTRDITAAGSARPTYRTNQVNSLPAVDFDGSDDAMSSASFTVPAQCAISVVFSLDTNKDYNGVAMIHSATPAGNPGTYQDVYVSSAGIITMEYNPSSIRYRQSRASAISASTWHILTASVGTENEFMRVNGASTPLAVISSSALAQTSGTGYLHIGDMGLGGGRLNGQIAEIAVWHMTAASNEHHWVEGYLADKYAITLAHGHLFRDAPPASAPTTYNAAGALLRVGLNGGISG